MIKNWIKAILLAGVFLAPLPSLAMGRLEVGVSVPPPLVFSSPPDVIVIPGTYVYVVADSDADVFFYDGWWWRPWEGRWYRSRNYASGWGSIQSVPSFYRGIPSGWRNDYRTHRWQGQPWNYRRIPHREVQTNWTVWERDKHWEKQNSWGVRDFQAPRQSREAPAQAIQPPSGPKPSDAVINHRDGGPVEKGRGDRGKGSDKRGKKNQGRGPRN